MKFCKCRFSVKAIWSDDSKVVCQLGDLIDKLSSNRIKSLEETLAMINENLVKVRIFIVYFYCTIY